MAAEESLPLPPTHEGDQPVEGSSHSATDNSSAGGASGSLIARPWYRLLNEDWWALILGLTLVVLIVARILHSIP